MRTVENGSGTVCGCAVGDDGTVDDGSALSCLGQTERFTTVLRESASGRLEGPPTAEDGCDSAIAGADFQSSACADQNQYSWNR